MKRISVVTVFLLSVISLYAQAWDIDFSRRQKMATPPDQSASEDTLGNEPAQHEAVSDAHVVPAPPATEVVPDTTENESSDDNTSVPSRLAGLIKRTVAPAPLDRQEFVILNTAKGFIPSNVRLHKGFHYTVHVVNVNEDKKNVSFMLDAFQQHHATYFGKIKSFDIDPNKEGVFEFQCPETAAQGKLVVFGNQLKIERHLSSEK